MATARIATRRLPTKTVRAPDGSTVKLQVVKADSETLAEDLLAAFRANVRQAKREHKRLAGSRATVTP